MKKKNDHNDNMQNFIDYNSKPITERRFSFLNIATEDEIFDLLNEQKVQEEKPIIQNKRLLGEYRLDSIKKKLFKVYKINPDFLQRIKEVKKLKNSLDLESYQANLIGVIGDNLEKESKRKLFEKLRRVRNLSNSVKPNDVNEFIEEIEKKEENIITNLKKKEEKLVSLRKTGIFTSSSPLPRIKYKKIKTQIV
jgi:hypothetical protein